MSQVAWFRGLTVGLFSSRVARSLKNSGLFKFADLIFGMSYYTLKWSGSDDQIPFLIFWPITRTYFFWKVQVFLIHWTSRNIHSSFWKLRFATLYYPTLKIKGGINFRENCWLNNAVKFPLTAFFLGCVRSQNYLLSTSSNIHPFISHKISPDLWILREVQCNSNQNISICNWQPFITILSVFWKL